MPRVWQTIVFVVTDSDGVIAAALAVAGRLLTISRYRIVAEQCVFSVAVLALDSGPTAAHDSVIDSFASHISSQSMHSDADFKIRLQFERFDCGAVK